MTTTTRAKPHITFRDGSRIVSRDSLTAEMAREVLNYDMDTGLLHWKFSRQGISSDGIAGCVKRDGYIYVKLFGVQYLAHRLAWLISFGTWPKSQIDHIDGNKQNNRLINLRDVSAAVNRQNLRRAHARNESGLLGVFFHRKRWRAQIELSGRCFYLGIFETPELAHQAYLEAKRRLHVGCTI